MKILIVGGSGFIGTRLVRTLLARDHAITIFDRNPSVEYPNLVTLGDVRNAQALNAVCTNHDIVIHLAAEHRDDVYPTSLYTDVNLGGTCNLLDACERNGIEQLIFVSTAAVYGARVDAPTEDAPLNPISPYGKSKAEAETRCMAWQAADAEKRCLSIVRPCVVFGEGNRGNLFNLIQQIHSRRFLMVGRGQNIKAICYVENLVDFLLTQMDIKPGVQRINYADQPQFTTRHLVNVIAKALFDGKVPRLIDRIWLPMPAALAIGLGMDWLSTLDGTKRAISATRVRRFCSDSAMNTERLQSLGFVPTIDLVEGIHRTIAHERRQGLFS